MTTTIQDKAIEICERLSCHEINDDDAACLQQEWDCDPRWYGIKRPYTPEEVLKLRGTLKVAYTFAEVGAARLHVTVNAVAAFVDRTVAVVVEGVAELGLRHVT